MISMSKDLAKKLNNSPKIGAFVQSKVLSAETATLTQSVLKQKKLDPKFISQGIINIGKKLNLIGVEGDCFYFYPKRPSNATPLNALFNSLFSNVNSQKKPFKDYLPSAFGKMKITLLRPNGETYERKNSPPKNGTKANQEVRKNLVKMKGIAGIASLYEADREVCCLITSSLNPNLKTNLLETRFANKTHENLFTRYYNNRSSFARKVWKTEDRTGQKKIQ